MRILHAAVTYVRRKFCRHDWENIHWEYGELILFRCSRCGAEIADPD